MKELFLPSQKKSSHKGENGRVLVLGGSEYIHGAPILAALGAEASGVDLISICLPKKYEIIACQSSLNFFVFPFQKNHFSDADIHSLLEQMENIDVLIIGCGLGKNTQTQKALLQLLKKTNKPVVLDADALIPDIFDIQKTNPWILTPHSREFERLFGLEPTPKNIQQKAKEKNVTILKKGVIDVIADSQGNLTTNKTGTSQMTVGGTGDALAGIVGGFWGQGLSTFDACKIGSYFWGRCGEILAQKQKTFSTREMLQHFPEIL